LDTADKTCPACGGMLEPWEGQFEQSEEVTVIRRRFEIVKHNRQKYRCRCAGCIETAPLPPKLFEGARYSIDFAVEVVIDKYNKHMPLERQVRSMAHDGLIIDSQTLWDQVWAVTEIVKPAYDRLLQHQWTHPVLGADETTWRLMGKNGKPDGGSKRCYVWCIVSPKAVYYHILESRSAAAAEKVLGGYKGIVVVDGYEVYPALAARVGFTVVHCWAHARRESVDVEKFFPEPAGQALDLIGKLYAVEDQCAPGPEGDEHRGALRATESKVIVEQIHDWALSTPVLPESGLGKAIKYMLGRWEGLIRFLDDPRIPLDNNATERELRNVVIGRKNHYGSRSQRGLIAASVLYSLIDTAILEGLNPREYLCLAVHRGLLGLPIPLPHEVAAELRALPADAP
jgi:transposase